VAAACSRIVLECQPQKNLNSAHDWEISRTIAFKADPNSSCELLYALSMPC
jgi:hypothetical protein